VTRSIVPVILSGGSGTRLWPLSREVTPKQLLALVTQRTLLQDTVLRARAVGSGGGAGGARAEGPHVESPVVICNESHRFMVAEQLREVDAGGARIVLEPAGRNTAPAVAVAAIMAPPDALLLVMPADHVITDTAAFAAAMSSAINAAAVGRLVTFGVVPTRAETGYGYIRRGPAQEGGWHLLDRFVEKPDAATAKDYLASGEYLWNSGMFVFTARTFLDVLAAHAPAMIDACRAAVADAEEDSDFLRLGPAFLDCPSDSIDYAVMEKTAHAAVVPLDAGWSDIGSWPALHEVLDKDGDGNVLRGDVIAEGCRDSYVLSTSRLVVTLGLDEHVVVETDDAVLVMRYGHAQKLKDVVEGLGRTTKKGFRDA
jgi:mannose-1-phosphate guanylyltransferase / mannose-6-phosphate isomerase